MIVDKISNWKNYFSNPVFESIFKDLEKYNLETPNGVYQENPDYYFKVMSYDTKYDSSIIESHLKEVDIQILLAGSEGIKIYDTNDVEVIEKYNDETDCQFYKPIADSISEIYLKPGYMAIFLPQDVHHPQFAVNNKIEKLKKIVIKVNEKFFTHK